MQAYLKYWRITKPVFSPNPELAQHFFSGANVPKMKLARMLANQAGTLQLVHGGAGVGKTSWLRDLIGSLDVTRVEPYFYLAQRGSGPGSSLLKDLADYFSTKKQGDASRLLAGGLEELKAEGRLLFLAIDAADRVDNVQIWHDLASLYDIGAAGGLVPSAIIIGNRTSLNVLRQIPSLSDRLSYAWEFTPFAPKETVAYLDFCCRTAGITKSPFHPESAEKISELSGGYVFAVNLLAETCLMQAADESKTEVLPEMVAALVAQLENHRQMTKRMPTANPKTL